MIQKCLSFYVTFNHIYHQMQFYKVKLFNCEACSRVQLPVDNGTHINSLEVKRLKTIISKMVRDPKFLYIWFETVTKWLDKKWGFKLYLCPKSCFNIFFFKLIVVSIIMMTIIIRHSKCSAQSTDTEGNITNIFMCSYNELDWHLYLIYASTCIAYTVIG